MQDFANGETRDRSHPDRGICRFRASNLTITADGDDAVIDPLPRTAGHDAARKRRRGRPGRFGSCFTSRRRTPRGRCRRLRGCATPAGVGRSCESGGQSSTTSVTTTAPMISKGTLQMARVSLIPAHVMRRRPLMNACRADDCARRPPPATAPTSTASSATSRARPRARSPCFHASCDPHRRASPSLASGGRADVATDFLASAGIR